MVLRLPITAGTLAPAGRPHRWIRRLLAKPAEQDLCAYVGN
jgi:hypothetical protein